ncbi:LTA synthase family protein [Agaribacterium haliotis]|uniref:LTA synthase family protein n=1 Tax=Agaribacterium haliotis TaxID=2013869 RepID=UPI000BB52E98|nr:sulfatase-like hydrolase/transferase [Agaribacterium haliotis]
MSRVIFWRGVSLALFVPLVVTGTAHFGAPSPSLLALVSSLATAFMLAFLCLGVSALPIPRFLAVSAITLLLLFSFGLTVGNWWHYQYFQAYLNFEYLLFANNAGAALNSVDEFEYRQALQWLSIGYVLLLLLFLWGALSKQRLEFRRRLSAGVVSVLLFAAVTTFVWVGAQISHVKRVNAFALSPVFLHPVHAFFYPLSNERGGAKEGWEYFKQKNTVVEKHAFLPSGYSAKSFNVLILTLESIRASFIGAYGDSRGLTPNFDAIAKESVLFSNFYANTNYTIKSENAILCGIFDHNAKLSIAEYSGTKNLDCLASVLAHEGYSSSYMHANSSRFYNRDNFMLEHGFSDLYFHADKVPHRDDGRRYIGWGLADTDFYDLALDRLESYSQPFFSQVLSISSHYPFQYDWPVDVPNSKKSLELMDVQERIYKGYENAVHYSDYALGEFWKSFKRSTLYENTIVLITADHGVWSFDSEKKLALLLDEEFFRVPLLIYHPEIIGGYRVDQVSSQVDIPLSVLDLVKAEYSAQNYIGKSIFDRVKEPWAVLMKGGGVSFRGQGRACIREAVNCSGAYQSCWAQTSASDSKNLTGSASCYEVEGDLLTGKALKKSEEDPGILGLAYDMIYFENQKVFADDKVHYLTKPSHTTMRELSQEENLPFDG